MKNLLLTTNHPAPYIDRWVLALFEKYEVTMIYNREKDSKKEWKTYKPYPGNFYSQLNYKQLKTLVKKQDILIVGGWTNKYCLETILLGKLYRKKVGIFTDYPFHQNRCADIFKKFFLYRWIDYVFCATRGTCELVKTKYELKEKKVKFFPYAADLSDVIQNMSSGGERIHILVANNFMERKGYETLFHALEIISRCDLRSAFEFHIAGHGEFFNKYKSEAEKMNLNVRFYGWVETNEYEKLQNMSEVFIHASYEEPFGIPPLDAMAKGKVVIVSDGVKSTEGLIKDGINGYIYPAHDAKELAYRIKGLLTADLMNIGKKAREDVRKWYSIQYNVDAVNSCFENDRGI